METGYIKIINKEGKSPSVEVELVKNNLWLAKFEIAHLFGCFNQAVEMNLRSIFKSRLLLENEATYTNRYTDKGIEKQCVFYNMDVLIFLSYRIGTLETQIFREFINNSFREHIKKKDTPQTCKIVWVAPPCYPSVEITGLIPTYLLSKHYP